MVRRSEIMTMIMNDNERENLPSNGLEKREKTNKHENSKMFLSDVYGFPKDESPFTYSARKRKEIFEGRATAYFFCQKTFGRRRNSSTKKSRNVGFFSKRLFFFSPER